MLLSFIAINNSRYLPYTEEVANALVDHIRDEGEKNDGHVDVRRVAGRWALESAAFTVFEKRIGALTDRIEWADKLIELNREIFRLSAELKFAIPLYRYFSTPKWIKLITLEDKFYKFVVLYCFSIQIPLRSECVHDQNEFISSEANLLIDEAIDKLSGSTQSEHEMKFASLLINRKDMNINDVKIILLSMFSDGLSTTAPMLIYNLYNIASNPEAQEELRNEINDKFKTLKEIDSTVLDQLTYLRACIKETFRLFPIGTEISRITQKDLVLSGYRIPSGTAIDINTNVLMKTTLFFKEPHRFNPNRWLRSSDERDEIHPFAFLPFGFGPRMCAGRRFAEQDLMVALCHLVKNFHITYRHKPIVQTYETLLLPKGCCLFHFEALK
ncbi:unspecific monooxygenase [Dictyocaulus viviparus]|uniref:Unspecific monooxygenase n=1 Tax=Dictyocaulus viviparus TaxID=29172 RepID=A0A0D8XSR3_DICVI|nr:unspecific monooxygenase [Dictyocaulus viviparus]